MPCLEACMHVSQLSLHACRSGYLFRAAPTHMHMAAGLHDAQHAARRRRLRAAARGQPQRGAQAVVGGVVLDEHAAHGLGLQPGAVPLTHQSNRKSLLMQCLCHHTHHERLGYMLAWAAPAGSPAARLQRQGLARVLAGLGGTCSESCSAPANTGLQCRDPPEAPAAASDAGSAPASPPSAAPTAHALAPGSLGLGSAYEAAGAPARARGLGARPSPGLSR